MSIIQIVFALPLLPRCGVYPALGIGSTSASSMNTNASSIISLLSKSRSVCFKPVEPQRVQPSVQHCPPNAQHPSDFSQKRTQAVSYGLRHFRQTQPVSLTSIILSVALTSPQAQQEIKRSCSKSGQSPQKRWPQVVSAQKWRRRFEYFE